MVLSCHACAGILAYVCTDVVITWPSNWSDVTANAWQALWFLWFFSWCNSFSVPSECIWGSKNKVSVMLCSSSLIRRRNVIYKVKWVYSFHFPCKQFAPASCADVCKCKHLIPVLLSPQDLTDPSWLHPGVMSQNPQWYCLPALLPPSSEWNLHPGSAEQRESCLWLLDHVQTLMHQRCCHLLLNSSRLHKECYMCLKIAIDGVEAAPSLRGSHLDVYGRCMEENLLVNLFFLL